MAYRVENYDIIAKLKNRFKLAFSAIVGNMDLGLAIHPVTDVDDLLKEAKIVSATVDISGAGWVTAFTVPTGKRWTLLGLDKPATTAASNARISEGTDDLTLNDYAKTGAHTQLFGRDYKLPEGWIIQFVGTSNGADNARVVSVWYLEEDAF